MARVITGQDGNSNVFAVGGQAAGLNALAGIGDEFFVLKEFYSSDTFTITNAMEEVIFMGFGGGGNGVSGEITANTGRSGGGGGFFQKTFRGLEPGTAFTLQVGGISGTTYLRDAANNILCQATGGTSGTTSAHGTGGTAAGGDINTNGAAGTADGGGAAGSPFGSSVGRSMYMVGEYARSYARFAASMARANGGDVDEGVGGNFGDGEAVAAGGTGGNGGFGGNGGNVATGSTGGGTGGNGGFGGNGGNVGNGVTGGGTGGNGGFGGNGGVGGASGGNGGFGGGGGKGNKGGNGGFGGGGGATTSSANNSYGGTGGTGGGGGACRASSGITALGGTGAILVLIKLKNGLTALHSM